MVLTLIGMSSENMKNAHLYRHPGAFFSDSMSLAGCQINPIGVNFHRQKNSDPNRTRGLKVPSLMPIKVKRKKASFFVNKSPKAKDH